MKYAKVIWLSVIALIFLLTFPKGVIISDEYSYLTIGLQLRSHLDFITDNNLNGLDIYHQKYLIGYPSIIAVMSLMGIKASYLANTIFFLLSVVWLRKLCKQLLLDPNWAYALCFFMPVVFSSRLLMSEMSAMFIVVLFLNAFFSDPSNKSYFILGFTCALSFWFREGTIVLLTPLVLYKGVTELRLVVPLLLGLICGLFPVLLQYSFYDILEIRNTGVSFGFSLFLENVILAFYVWILVFPLGLYCAYKSRIPKKKIILFAMVTYTIMQVLYQYNGWELTGFKTLISYPRFFVVLAPFFILFYGSSLIKVKPQFIYIFSILTYFVFSISLFYVDSQYEKVRLMVYDNIDTQCLHSNGSINEVSKIIFPKRGRLTLGMIQDINLNRLKSDDIILDVKRLDSPVWISSIKPNSEGQLVDTISILGFLQYRLYKID